ncbi:MAG: DNA polymerase III subunit delta' [Oscillibacter sp.]|nr:DNA polymerase III subunit delta' [Oscillibacter sp.]
MANQEIPAIPGEPRLSLRVREAAGRDALGHAAILSGQGDLAAAARFMAAAFQCQGRDKPCGACPDCRKVFRSIHPDVVTVVDPDHKNIAVDVLRGVVSDASVLPNEGRRKVYIFPDCSLLDSKAQNVLLKVVEDGPPHAAFIFCARNSAVLLSTIRSRATEWKMAPPREEAAPADGRARQLCQAICSGKAPELAGFCAELENSKISREELKALLSDTRDLLVSGLAAACTGQGGTLAVQLAGMGKYKLSTTVESLGGFIRQCNYNIGVGHLLGALAVELSR